MMSYNAPQHPGNMGPQQPYFGYPTMMPLVKPTNVLAIIALTSGILGFLGGFLPLLGTPLGIIAVVFGILGLRASRSIYGSGKVMSTVGLVLGAVGLLASLAMVAFVFSEVRAEQKAVMERVSAATEYSTPAESLIPLANS